MALKLFNRCESINPKSVIGPDFTAIGTPDIVSGKWGTAVSSDSNTKGLISGAINRSDYNNFNKFAFECWVKLTYAVTNGLSGSPNDYNCIFEIRDGVHAERIWFLLFSTGVLVTINSSSAQPITVDARFDIPANTWTHLAWTVNMAGIGGGSDTMQIRINNVLSMQFTTAIADYPNANGYMYALNPLSDFYSLLGAIDNIKMWNYDKTDFKDSMNNERSGLADQVICG